jgi:hypothetical protein
MPCPYRRNFATRDSSASYQMNAFLTLFSLR